MLDEMRVLGKCGLEDFEGCECIELLVEKEP